MPQIPLNDLAAFTVVARERSFTNAAKLLGVSPSALSHSIRGLEERVGVRLLARTTRSVAPTEAGERLLATLLPALAEIDAGLATLRNARETPVGTVRITAVKHAVQTLLLPMLPNFSARYPDIRLEIHADDGFVDIVAQGYDVGLRFADKVEKDMIAVAIGPALHAAVIASPSYLKGRTRPASPRDLAEHRCIVHRRADGGLHPWPFKENNRVQQVRLEGALVCNDSDLVLEAAIAGQGVACVFEERAAPLIGSGALVKLLAPYCAPMTGYALYYPSRRHHPPALAMFIEAVRGLGN